MTSNSRSVYSTAGGRLCPDCKKSVSACQCKSRNKQSRIGDGVVRIQRESKGRNGKSVCLISGIPLSTLELEILAKELKNKFATGGTVKSGIIEIQGDHRDNLKLLLEAKGYQVKLAGG